MDRSIDNQTGRKKLCAQANSTEVKLVLRLSPAHISCTYIVSKLFQQKAVSYLHIWSGWWVVVQLCLSLPLLVWLVTLWSRTLCPGQDAITYSLESSQHESPSSCLMSSGTQPKGQNDSCIEWMCCFAPSLFLTNGGTTVKTLHCKRGKDGEDKE